MNENPDKQQEELQRILAGKSHPLPPRSLSNRVMDRLAADDGLEPESPWHHLGLGGDGRPVLVCLSGILVCGLLVFGLIASLKVGPTQSAPPPPAELSHLNITPAPTAPPETPEQLSPTNPALNAIADSLAQPVIVPSTLHGQPPPSAQQAAFKTKRGRE